LTKILTNVLTALYQPFGFSLLLSFFALFFYLYAYQPYNAGKGWKEAILTWFRTFKENKFFRKLFLLAFVEPVGTGVVVVLLCTRLNYCPLGFARKGHCVLAHS